MIKGSENHALNGEFHQLFRFVLIFYY